MLSQDYIDAVIEKDQLRAAQQASREEFESVAPRHKCGRCRGSIGDIGDSAILKIENFNGRKDQIFLLCEKCRCQLLEWILMGDPIQQMCDKG